MAFTRPRLGMLLLLSATPGLFGNSTYPPRMPDAREEVYKTVDDVELKLYVFEPEGHRPSDKRPAIVFFFGGGWQHGSPQQFEMLCKYFASRGLVAISADYRVKSRHKIQFADCIYDAKAAIRHVRANAGRLGVDPDRIAASGASAGGHLAACTAIVPGFEEEAQEEGAQSGKVTSAANALILYCPALVIAPVPEKDLGPEAEEFLSKWNRHCVPYSPYHHIREKLPPTIIFYGTNDKTVPFATATAFVERMKEMNNRCELVAYEREGHPFLRKPRLWLDSTKRADAFLVSLGYLEGKDTAEAFHKAHRQ